MHACIMRFAPFRERIVSLIRVRGEAQVPGSQPLLQVVVELLWRSGRRTTGLLDSV